MVAFLRRCRPLSRSGLAIAIAFALIAGLVEPITASAAPAASSAAPSSTPDTSAAATAAQTAGAADPQDIALDGYGDADGYHLQVSRGSSGFGWQEIAVLRPAVADTPSWTGYQCVSGDGRYAAVAILPTDQVNDAVSRDHGGYAYSVDLTSGDVHPIASGIGLKYYSPGCGAADTAVFTTMLGTDQSSTVLTTADLSTGAVAGSVTVTGQVTSAVPTDAGPVGVMGSALVSIGANGSPTVLATVHGDAYQLRPAANGDITFLSTEPGADTATVHRESASQVTDLGQGPRTRLQLFAGRDGGSVLSGAVSFDGDAAKKAEVTVVPDNGLPIGANSASLDGHLLVGAASDAASDTPVQLVPGSSATQPVARSAAATGAAADPAATSPAPTSGGGTSPTPSATGPNSSAATSPVPVTDAPTYQPPGVADQNGADQQADPQAGQDDHDLKPSGDAAPVSFRSSQRAVVVPAAATLSDDTYSGAATVATAATVSTADRANTPAASPKQANAPPAVESISTRTTTQATSTQTPTCAVPRGDLTRQVMQPSPAQADWAAQMAEQGLLTGSAYTRPANFANMGFAAYAPSTDFPPTPLQHPSGSSTTTVPRIVFEAIMAQESNFSQASWHAPAGNAGDPLIADYYGAHGDIVSINYAGADCGYGISQVTTGMHVGDSSLSARGQAKVAVDYQENIAAGLQILQDKWNQLYSAGIIANNGDPQYLENWYFAIWAYNGGLQPSTKYNSTGCTPGPSCTGPHGTWGLGWTNNPDNLDYPPNRLPYLQASYADAAHPASWPYQERVMGWMASPIQRYGARAYAKPTYNGGQSWLQIPAFSSFCSLSGNNCDPVNTNTSNPGASHCMYDDFECWWHTPVTWVSNCSTTCATSPYTVGSGSGEPAFANPNPPTCTVDSSKVPTGSIIVDDEPVPPLNLQGCNSPNWSSGGTFSYHPGTNSAGDPIGSIDTHQLGVGLGGHVWFTHTEDGSNPDLINTGTWTPNLPSLQYYTVKIHVPSIGATATNVVYTINPGGGATPWKVRVNQDFGSEQWATIGTFAMQNGGSVVLTNQSTTVNTTNTKYYNFDVAFDAIAFVPQGGTPGAPIGGPPTVQDEPNGSNPAWLQCGCAQRTAGDPVNTATGYFGDSFTDLSTPGRGAALALTRTYAGGIADATGPNKSLAADGPFGYGWTYSYNMAATTAASNGNVTVRQEDGSSVAFVNQSGTYSTAAPRFDATLTKSGSTYTYTRGGRALFQFDVTTGRLIAETDLAGSQAPTPYWTKLAYDSSGHLSTVTDPAGRLYTLTWTGNHITGVKDSAGRTVTYAYNSSGDLTDVYGVGTTRSPSLQSDDRMQYTYVAGKHLMASMRTPKNYGGASTAVTAMAYDGQDRVTSQTDPLGHATTFTYGPSSSPSLQTGQTLVTDPAGHKTLDTYQNGLLVSRTVGFGTADAGTTSYTYDPVSLGVSSSTDADGHLSTFTYDTHGNRTSVSGPDGFTTSSMWDDHGDLIESVDATGVATVNVYDQAGHVAVSGGTNKGGFQFGDLTSTSVTQANNVVESTTGNFGSAPTRSVNYFYDDAAHPADVTRTVDANQHTSTATYDAFGDVSTTTDAAGDVTAFGYNTGTGWRTSTVDGNGTAAGVKPGCTPPAKGCTAVTYTALGQVASVTDGLGHVSKATYDADGNRASSTDPNGRTTTTAFDSADRPVSVTQPDGTVAATDYNADNTVADTVDALKAKTSYGYDGQGRLTSTTDPDGRTVRSTVDPAGLVTAATDATGRATTLAHDPVGRVTAITYSDTATHGVTVSYDADGRRVGMTDGTGTSSWAFDAFGELVSAKDGSGATVGYGYDNVGNLTSLTYPGQTTPVARGFDAADRLTSVKDFAGASTTFAYDHDSALTGTTYPGGSTVTNAFDNAEQLTGTTAAKSGSTLAAFTYGRDNAGQITSQNMAGAAQTFTYSTREQLATSVSGSTTTGYTYDAANHPTKLGNVTATFDAAGQECWSTTASVSSPTCGSKPSGATTYTFDGNGQRTASTPATGTASSYAYDQAGRLTSAKTGAGSGTYAYNGLGLRVGRSVSGTTTAQVWDNASVPNLLVDGSTRFIYGPDGLPIEQTGSAGTFFFVHDQIGSTRTLLSSSGTVAGSYTYTPYGVPTHTGSASTPLQFSGQYTDAETGLVYLRARYYDPATAQFLTIDPLVGVTGTPYAYVVGNPLNHTDPTGRDCGFWCWAGITVAVVAVSVATAGLADAAIAAGGAGAAAAEVAGEGGLGYEALEGAAAEGETEAGAGSSAAQIEVPDAANEALTQIRAGKWPPPRSPGTKGGSLFRNKDGTLPSVDENGDPLSYTEWDVNRKVPGQNRDSQRIVTCNQNGKAYYTPDHYETFVQMD